MLPVYRRWCKFIKKIILSSTSQATFHKKKNIFTKCRKQHNFFFFFFTKGAGNKVSWQQSDLHEQKPKAVQAHRALLLAGTISLGGPTLEEHIAERDFKDGVQATSLKIKPCQEASLGAFKITSFFFILRGERTWLPQRAAGRISWGNFKGLSNNLGLSVWCWFPLQEDLLRITQRRWKTG